MKRCLDCGRPAEVEQQCGYCGGEIGLLAELAQAPPGPGEAALTPTPSEPDKLGPRPEIARDEPLADTVSGTGSEPR